MNITDWQNFIDGKGADLITIGRFEPSIVSLFGALDDKIYIEREIYNLKTTPTFINDIPKPNSPKNPR